MTIICNTSVWSTSSSSDIESLDYQQLMIDMQIAAFCSRCNKKCLDRLFRTAGVLSCKQKPVVWEYKSPPIDYGLEDNKYHYYYYDNNSSSWRLDPPSSLDKLREDLGL